MTGDNELGRGRSGGESGRRSETPRAQDRIEGGPGTDRKVSQRETNSQDNESLRSWVQRYEEQLTNAREPTDVVLQCFEDRHGVYVLEHERLLQRIEDPDTLVVTSEVFHFAESKAWMSARVDGIEQSEDQQFVTVRSAQELFGDNYRYYLPELPEGLSHLDVLDIRVTWKRNEDTAEWQTARVQVGTSPIWTDLMPAAAAEPRTDRGERRIDESRAVDAPEQFGRRAGTAYAAEILAMQPKAFSESVDAQRRLFVAAGETVARCRAVGDRALAGVEGSCVSIRKGERKESGYEPDFDAFVHGILEKCDRKKTYEKLQDMPDIIRGRIDVKHRSDVKLVVDALRHQTELLVTEVVPPRRDGRDLVFYGRYHVVLQDPVTNLRHEFQVGTSTDTWLFEEKGIDVPADVRTEAERLGKRFNADLHDIAYDVFATVEREDKDLAEDIGISDLLRQMHELSDYVYRADRDGSLSDSQSSAARARKGLPPMRHSRLAILHADASRVLQRLVRERGATFVAERLH